MSHFNNLNSNSEHNQNIPNNNNNKNLEHVSPNNNDNENIYWSARRSNPFIINPPTRTGSTSTPIQHHFNDSTSFLIHNLNPVTNQSPNFDSFLNFSQNDINLQQNNNVSKGNILNLNLNSIMQNTNTNNINISTPLNNNKSNLEFFDNSYMNSISNVLNLSNPINLNEISTPTFDKLFKTPIPLKIHSVNINDSDPNHHNIQFDDQLIETIGNSTIKRLTHSLLYNLDDSAINNNINTTDNKKDNKNKSKKNVGADSNNDIKNTSLKIPNNKISAYSLTPTTGKLANNSKNRDIDYYEIQANPPIKATATISTSSTNMNNTNNTTTINTMNSYNILNSTTLNTVISDDMKHSTDDTHNKNQLNICSKTLGIKLEAETSNRSIIVDSSPSTIIVSSANNSIDRINDSPQHKFNISPTPINKKISSILSSNFNNERINNTHKLVQGSTNNIPNPPLPPIMGVFKENSNKKKESNNNTQNNKRRRVIGTSTLNNCIEKPIFTTNNNINNTNIISNPKNNSNSCFDKHGQFNKYKNVNDMKSKKRFRTSDGSLHFIMADPDQLKGNKRRRGKKTNVTNDAEILRNSTNIVNNKAKKSNFTARFNNNHTIIQKPGNRVNGNSVGKINKNSNSGNNNENIFLNT